MKTVGWGLLAEGLDLALKEQVLASQGRKGGQPSGKGTEKDHVLGHRIPRKSQYVLQMSVFEY